MTEGSLVAAGGRREYAMATIPKERMEELVQHLAGGTITPQDLVTVRVPAGGALTWETVNDGGEIIPAAEIRGVIVGVRPARAYWSQRIGETAGRSPPDCSSQDAVIGRGMRWDGDNSEAQHDCGTCKLSRFGSKLNPDGSQGKGQACKEVRRIYLIEPGSILPTVVVAPPMSIQPVKRYLLQAVISRGRSPYEVETVLKLAKAVNANGIGYSRIQPVMGGVLDEKLQAALKEKMPFLLQILEHAARRPVEREEAEPGATADDYNGGTE